MISESADEEQTHLLINILCCFRAHRLPNLHLPSCDIK